MTIGAKFNGMNIGLALLLALSVMIAPLSAAAEQQAESFDGSVIHHGDHEDDHELDGVEDKSGDHHDKFHAHSCGTCHIHVYGQTAMVDIAARSPASLFQASRHLDPPSTGSGGLFRPPRA